MIELLADNVEGYGLTETASSATANDPGDFRIGTVGRPVDGCEIRLDEDGEILIRSDAIFAGYYKEPEATAAVLSDDGWFRSGDLGRFDEDGYLYVVDRKKDMIKTGGENVAARTHNIGHPLIYAGKTFYHGENVTLGIRTGERAGLDRTMQITS